MMVTELNEKIFIARLGGVDLRGSPHSRGFICDVYIHFFVLCFIVDIDGDVDIFLRPGPSLLCILCSWLMEVAHVFMVMTSPVSLNFVFAKLWMIICSGGVIPVSSICVVHRF
jgi:hypothetical protein